MSSSTLRRLNSYEATLSASAKSPTLSRSPPPPTPSTPKTAQLTGILNANDIKELPIFSLNPYTNSPPPFPGIADRHPTELQSRVPRPGLLGQRCPPPRQQLPHRRSGDQRRRHRRTGLPARHPRHVLHPRRPLQLRLGRIWTRRWCRHQPRHQHVAATPSTAQRTSATPARASTPSPLPSASPRLRPPAPPRPASIRHTFGFTAGGPIYKDKLFFFGAGQLAALLRRKRPRGPSGIARCKRVYAQSCRPSRPEAEVHSRVAQAATFRQLPLSNYAYLNSFSNTTALATPGKPLRNA